MVHDPQPIRQSGRRLCHAMESLPDVRKPEGCCPQRSCAPSFIAQLEDLVPGRSRKVRLQPVALESGLPEPEATAALTFRDSPTEALFDNGLHCCSLSVCQLSYLIVKTVWYLYGCFHMANHIILYGKMSRHSKKEWRVQRGGNRGQELPLLKAEKSGANLKGQIATFKWFKKLMQQWGGLAIRHSPGENHTCKERQNQVNLGG